MTVEVNNESGSAVDEVLLLRLASFVLERMFVHPATEVGILLVDEGAMEKLHEDWLNETGPTDVLSFPMDELRPGRADSPTPAGILGDVVICPVVAGRQAAAAGHSVDTEMNVLLVHGMLHLLGFDHGTPLEEAEMFGIQGELLAGFADAQDPA